MVAKRVEDADNTGKGWRNKNKMHVESNADGTSMDNVSHLDVTANHGMVYGSDMEEVLVKPEDTNKKRTIKIVIMVLAILVILGTIGGVLGALLSKKDDETNQATEAEFCKAILEWETLEKSQQTLPVLLDNGNRLRVTAFQYDLKDKEGNAIESPLNSEGMNVGPDS